MWLGISRASGGLRDNRPVSIGAKTRMKPQTLPIHVPFTSRHFPALSMTASDCSPKPHDQRMACSTLSGTHDPIQPHDVCVCRLQQACIKTRLRTYGLNNQLSLYIYTPVYGYYAHEYTCILQLYILCILYRQTVMFVNRQRAHDYLRFEVCLRVRRLFAWLAVSQAKQAASPRSRMHIPLSVEEVGPISD